MTLLERVLRGFGPEDREQFTVIRYCAAEGIPIFHVPNNTWTKSVMQKTRNNLLGVRKGVPDLFVIPGPVIAIEMKQLGYSKTSPEQKEWIERLNTAGIPAKVCKGADAAIEFIEEHRRVG